MSDLKFYKCPCCGAPLNPSLGKCEYCDTPFAYSVNEMRFDTPYIMPVVYPYIPAEGGIGHWQGAMGGTGGTGMTGERTYTVIRLVQDE